jgi:DNA-directed RNA polymerase subunit RPC12/RpoP
MITGEKIMLVDNKKPDQVAIKELKVYRCPECNKILLKGFVLSLALSCPYCNQFVLFAEKVQQS